MRVARIAALSKAKKTSECVELGLSAMNDTGDTVSAADFAYHALACADASESTHVSKRRALREHAVERLSSLCSRNDTTLTPDDRSDACALLHAAKSALDDTAS